MQNVFHFYDDMIVALDNEEEHYKLLEELFRKLCEREMFINLKKCKLRTFLGLVVFLGRFVPDKALQISTLSKMADSSIKRDVLIKAFYEARKK